MDCNLTEIVIILDRSGSMECIRQDMEGGLNQFIEEQKAVEGQARVTFVQFDDQYEMVLEDEPIELVGRLVLTPRGMTALLDAVGKTINAVGQRLAVTQENRRPGKVLVVIITDGQENHSTEFTRDQVKAMIQRQQNDYNWQFTYLGANQDSFAEAGSMGISRDATINYCVSTSGVCGMSMGLNRATQSYRTTGEALCYTDEDREDAMEK